MTAIAQFLDWLDEAAARLIRVAYLLAGVTAVAVYFGAGHLPPSVESALNGILPWALSFAVETHTYITARRVRAAWQEKQAGALKVNLAVLAGLLAFSAWNQLNYLYETWTPPHTALALPGWLAYVVRALVVPGAFMAAAFLAPLAQPVAAQIEAEARNVLADVFRIARRQRKTMLKAAQREGRDMTGALVELVPDPELRRIIAHAYGAIGSPVAGSITHDGQLALVESPLTRAQESTGAGYAASTVDAPGDEPTPAQTLAELPAKPPTGPGSPTSAPRRASKRTRRGNGGRPAILKLTPPPAEERIRALIIAEPNVSIRQLAKRAGTSESTASKWRRVITSEADGQKAAQ